MDRGSRTRDHPDGEDDWSAASSSIWPWAMVSSPGPVAEKGKRAETGWWRGAGGRLAVAVAVAVEEDERTEPETDWDDEARGREEEEQEGPATGAGA